MSDHLEVVRLPFSCGAEIRGVDLRALSDRAFGDIRKSWLENLVIVIRGQQLTDEDLTRFSQYFGVLDELPPIGKGQKPRDNKFISVISNVVENGVPIGGLADDEVIWHSDTSYRERPPSASILYSLEIPTWGGNTGFANMYLALETLDADLRRRIDRLEIKNDTTYNAGGQLREGFEPVTDVRKCPGATHPMVRTHPETRNNCLYLGRRRNAYVPGLSIEESEELLDTLWRHATQEFLTWHHEWKVGDVVIWDNRCAMHRRDHFDPNTRRVVHRAQARDDLRPARDFSVADIPHARGLSFVGSTASAN